MRPLRCHDDGGRASGEEPWIPRSPVREGPPRCRLCSSRGARAAADAARVGSVARAQTLQYRRPQPPQRLPSLGSAGAAASATQTEINGGGSDSGTGNRKPETVGRPLHNPSTRPPAAGASSPAAVPCAPTPWLRCSGCGGGGGRGLERARRGCAGPVRDPSWRVVVDVLTLVVVVVASRATAVDWGGCSKPSCSRRDRSSPGTTMRGKRR